jgi:primary-amine oxidase
MPGRLIQAFMYALSCPGDNAYAHPIDFVPIVDLDLGKARLAAL